MNEIKVFEGEEVRIELALKINRGKDIYYTIYKQDTNEDVGFCSLRLEKNYENYYLGNVGYSIREQYRGNNYAYKACQLIMKAAAMFDVKDLLITANPENTASIKTIRKLGVRFVEVVKVPRNHVLYKQGDRYVAIYEWDLKKGEKRI